MSELSHDAIAIDAELSRFTVQAFAGGIVVGASATIPTIAIRDFSGEALLSRTRWTTVLAAPEIRADSLDGARRHQR